MAINSDFIKQSTFLSQQLECSERYTASLLLHVHRQNPNLEVAATIEACVAEHHLRRRYLADCLKLLFEAANMKDEGDTTDVYLQIDTYLKTDVLPGLGGVSFPQRIFIEMEMLELTLQKANAARQNAKSSTTGPDAGKHSCHLR